jgi:hypothetical protein
VKNNSPTILLLYKKNAKNNTLEYVCKPETGEIVIGEK